MQSSLEIRKLRVRPVRDIDGLAWRRQAECALNQVELPALTRQSGAVLCVRSLRMRVDIQMRARERRNEPASMIGSLHDALERLAQTALHPARSFVPANAQAVIFADQAELLACLALDFLQGRVKTQWWWPALFPNLDAAPALHYAWRSEPRHVPAALVRLHDSGQSGPFLRALPAETCATIAMNVAHAFAAEEPRRLIEQLSKFTSADTVAPPLQTPPALSPAPLAARGRNVRLSPWSPWLPVEPAVSPEARTVLILAIMLIRAPAVLRSSRFVRALEEFSVVIPADPIPLNLASSVTSTNADSSSQPNGAQRSPVPRLPALAISAAPVSGLVLANSAIAAPAPGAASPPMTNRQPIIEDESPMRPGHLDTTSRGIEPLVCIRPAEVPPDSPVSPSSTETPSAPIAFPIMSAPQSPSWRFSTEWGGVFYLINVSLALELYGDFTRPRHPSLPLGLWDFLALLGQELVGSAFPRDPCWMALGSLSGRSQQESPGAWFEPPVAWRVPISWLAPFPERDRWCCRWREGRLELVHPAGFCALNIPCPKDQAMAEFRRECLRFALSAEAVSYALEAPAPEVTSAAEAPGPYSTDGSAVAPHKPLERWLAWLGGYIRARLSRALEINNPDQLRQLIFQRPAELLISSENVQVHFSLADHPLVIRLAGLDRDPGWVPASGRTITFHYE